MKTVICLIVILLSGLALLLRLVVYPILDWRERKRILKELSRIAEETVRDLGIDINK